MGSASPALEVGIIGAGIAGLAAAIALRRAGHIVEIYEKSSFKDEIGAAITFTPNANKILTRWGLDYEAAGSTDKLVSRRVKPDTLEMVAFTSFEDVPSRFKSVFNAFHRVDIHRALKELATAAGSGVPVKIHLGVDVETIDCELGALTTKDGRTIRKDLLVVADGIKYESRFIKDVNDGKEVPRHMTGSYVHRSLIDIDKLMQNELTRQLYEGQPSGFCNTVNRNTGVMIVSYPCRSDKVMNLAIFHGTRESEEGVDEWNASADIKDVLSLVDEGFHPAWVELVKVAGPNNWKFFPVSKRDPLDRASKGKVVIIGDAAHAMLPTHAQGGSMALEDSAALEVLFSDFQSGNSVEELLLRFKELRLPRSATTQLLSNAMMGHHSAEKVVEHIRQYYNGALPVNAESFSLPIQRFFWDYDIYAQAEKAKHAKDPAHADLKYFGDFGVIDASNEVQR